MSEFLELDNVSKIFKVGTLISRISIPAVWKVTFSLPERPVIFSLVGESGSGKSTLANLLLRLIKPTSGEIYLRGKKLEEYSQKEFLRMVQPIFQNPFESFNPLKKVETYIFSTARAFSRDGGRNLEENISRVLASVGISLEQIRGKYPHEFSGGQLQRLAIARALLADPELLVADEPVSMLDVSLRVSILNLFKELRDRFKKKIIYITHDLATAYYVSDLIAVMLRGTIVEMGPAGVVLNHPLHPYTVLLRQSVPDISKESVQTIKVAEEKSKLERKTVSEEYTLSGCKFYLRCPYATQQCLEEPPYFQVENRMVKCWLFQNSQEGGTKHVVEKK
ncbi:ABC transporter ATP-binding protein [Thermotoga sp. 38H-to]|uniref:ABC transporter ATP-binding protein n=1 Tax=Thermotoga sp. 38H-to TaxID=1755812 RepID=UPI00040B600B|nr:ABC transporter ATP-binding protein [Thermotoga sp. 38H-to]KAF2959455.1 hypothetical protein AS158_07745 [Thermotoga sp. 38H-to]